MTLISGIPPWMQMYFDRLTSRTGKKIKEIFPNLSVMVHGGVNFEPYRAKLLERSALLCQPSKHSRLQKVLWPSRIHRNAEGLLLNTDSGIFFEFIRASEIFQ